MDLDAALPAPIRALPAIGGQVQARRLQATGCEVLFVTAPGGAELPRHEHDTQNTTVIISGEMVLITEDGETHHGPGDWYETSPGEMHALRFEDDTVQIELRFDTSA